MPLVLSRFLLRFLSPPRCNHWDFSAICGIYMKVNYCGLTSSNVWSRPWFTTCFKIVTKLNYVIVEHTSCRFFLSNTDLLTWRHQFWYLDPEVISSFCFIFKAERFFFTDRYRQQLLLGYPVISPPECFATNRFLRHWVIFPVAIVIVNCKRAAISMRFRVAGISQRFRSCSKLHATWWRFGGKLK